MNIVIKEDFAAMSIAGSEYILENIKAPQNICFATGKTPMGLYDELTFAYKDGHSFANVSTFNLDEYYRVPKNNPSSCAGYMTERFFDNVDMKAENINFIDAMAADYKAECARYEQLILDAGGLDITILGLGENGHLGFNEPGTTFDSRTRRVTLAPITRVNNAYTFGDSIDDVPEFGLTIGLATIMASKSILMLVSGKQKAKILQQVLDGPITEEVPASILQMHPNITFIVDKEAASLLSK